MKKKITSHGLQSSEQGIEYTRLSITAVWQKKYCTFVLF